MAFLNKIHTILKGNETILEMIDKKIFIKKRKKVGINKNYCIFTA